MTEEELFAEVAKQLSTGDFVELEGKRYQVKRTGAQRLRIATFVADGVEFTAIEQNPEKPSRWGKLAREGHKVVQFKEVESGKFVAVSVDGKVKRYGG